MISRLFFIVVFLMVHPAYGGVHYQIGVQVPEGALRSPEPIAGQTKIRWQDSSEFVCFYFAYNDPSYFWDPSRNINRSMNKNKSFQPTQGRMELLSQHPGAVWQGPILKLPNRGQESFEFSFILPQWPDRARQQFLFHQFYPQKLGSCPAEDGGQGLDFPNAEFKLSVLYPRRWVMTTPGFHNQNEIRMSGRNATFNLSLDHKVEHFFVDKIPVTIVYRSKYMSRAKFYLQSFLRQAQGMLGEFPFPRLLFLETEELEKGAIPGVITMNRPRQAGMRLIQNDLLNWGLWQLAFYTSQQWFGASLQPANPQDGWFFRGSADFIASLLLQADQRIYNIINSDDGRPWVLFNHRQSADLIASILNILKPENALTDEVLKTRISYFEQHNFNYIRHLLALRYAYWRDREAFMAALKEFTETYRDRNVDQRTFITFLHKGSAIRQKLAEEVSKWWTSSAWPDFDLDNVDINESQGERRLVLKVDQNPAFRLPYDVEVTWGDGQKQSIRAEATDKIVEVKIDGERSVDRVEINPGREIFDSNRFNNHNEWPDVVFFPGNADTIRDDAYTVVWFPFPSKLPGEELSLMLSSQIFRYVNSGLTILFAHVPSENRTGYNAMFLTDLPEYSLFTALSAVQDFGASMKGQRILDWNVTRSNLLKSTTDVTLGLRFRYRGEIAHSAANHGTSAISLNVSPQSWSSCDFKVFGIYERSFAAQEFSYHRSFGIGNWGCRLKSVGLGLRGFWGAVEERGTPPSYVRFNPQTLDEGRMRIDEPVLTEVPRLWTASVDIDFPAYIPLPSALFLLPRHSRWRLFYDYGQGLGSDEIYEDFGVGFKLPFGGDVVGKRSLSLASLSILAVLQKRYEGKKSSSPGILIDFLGKL